MKGRKRKVTTLSVLIAFGLLILLIPQASATVVYIRDFNDGVMDWTVGQGNFIVYEHTPTDYALYSGSSGTIGEWCWKQIPDMSDGTWSFDFFYPQVNNGWMRLYFFLNGTLGDPWYGYNFYGYYLETEIDDWTDPTSLRLMKIDNGTETLIGFTVFDDSICGSWTRINVTRDSATGKINVWANGTHEIQGSDSTFTHSEKFCFYTEKRVNTVLVGAMLDNLVIEDEITIYPPGLATTTPTTGEETTTPTGPNGGTPNPIDPMLLIAVGGGIVVLLVIVILLRRR
jgi:hypothetical protein